MNCCCSNPICLEHGCQNENQGRQMSDLQSQCWICPICFDDHKVNDAHVYCEPDDLLKLATRVAGLESMFDSINKHVLPGTCDSVDSMMLIIKERDELRAENELLKQSKTQPEAEIGLLKESNDKLCAELDEQCRLNGMGAQRELKLMTELATYQKQLEIAKYSLNQIMSGLTTQQSQVENMTKRLAHDTLADIRAPGEKK